MSRYPNCLITQSFDVAFPVPASALENPPSLKRPEKAGGAGSGMGCHSW